MIRVLILLFLFYTIYCQGLTCSNPDIECTKHIKVGTSLAIIDPNVSLPHVYFKVGIDVFMEWQKNQKFCIMNNESVEIRFCFDEPEIKFDYNMAPMIEASFKELDADPTIDYIFANIDGQAIIAKEAISKGRLLIATFAISPSFTNGSSNVFSVMPPFYVGISSIIPNYRFAGARTATLLKPDVENADEIYARQFEETCYDVEKQLSRSYFTKYNVITFMPDRNDEGANESYVLAANKLKEIDNDLVIYCGTSGTILQYIIQNMRYMNYVPKGILSGGTKEFAFDREIANFVTHSSLITAPKNGFPPSNYIKTLDEYMEIFKRVHPEYYQTVDPVYMYGITYSFAFETLLNGIAHARSFDNNDLIHAIRTGVYESFVGETTYTSSNVNMNPGISVQIANDRNNIFAPSTVSNNTIVYPIPTWDERVESYKYHATEIVVIAILILCILNSLGWIVYIIIFRKEEKITASSPVFLVCMLAGSIIIYVGLFFWMPMHTNSAGCSIFVGFLTFGFMLLFGSMVVKTWRVHVLFSRKSLDVFKISNQQVAIFLTILLVVDVIFYLAWVLVTKSTAVLIVPDEYRPSLNYYICSSKKAGEAIIWSLIAYNLLIFLYGAYLALQVRRIPFKIYDESKIIAFCIYNVGLVAIIVCILEGTNASSNRYVQFIVRSILIILSTAVTINTMFIGKATVTFRNTSLTSKSSDLSYNMKSRQHASNSDDDEVDLIIKKLKKDKKALKKENKELKKALEALKNVSESDDNA